MTSGLVGLFSSYFKNHVNISISMIIRDSFIRKSDDGLAAEGVFNCALGSPGILQLSDGL